MEIEQKSINENEMDVAPKFTSQYNITVKKHQLITAEMFSKDVVIIN